MFSNVLEGDPIRTALVYSRVGRCNGSVSSRNFSSKNEISRVEASGPESPESATSTYFPSLSFSNRHHMDVQQVSKFQVYGRTTRIL